MLTKVVCTHSLDRTKNKQSSSLPNTNTDQVGQNNKRTVLLPTKHKHWSGQTEQQTNSPPPYQTQTLIRSDRTTSEQPSTLPYTNTDQVRQKNKWTVCHLTKNKCWSGRTEQQVNSLPPDKKQMLIRSDWTSEQPSTRQKTNTDQIRLNKWTALQVSSKVLCWRPCCQCQGVGQQNQTRGQMWEGQTWVGQTWAAHTHKQPQASRAPTDDLQPCFSQSWRYQSSPSEHRDTRSHHLQSNLTPVCSAHVPQSEMMLQAFETNQAFKVSPSVWNACWF